MAERECCDKIVAVSTDVESLKADSIEFREFMKEMRDAMTYRLPLWATFAMSALTGIVGWLLASR
jgi:hypothetical protein